MSSPKSAVIDWSHLPWLGIWKLWQVCSVLAIPGIVYSYGRTKTSKAWAAQSICVLNLWFCLFCLFHFCFSSGEMAKRTFSMLETFLIFLLVMMTAVTVALLSILFITSGTIENHKGKLSWALLGAVPSLWEIPWLLGMARQRTMSADNADNRAVQCVLKQPGMAL